MTTQSRICLRLIVVTFLISICMTEAYAGRVPTKYNDRYQALYAEQETFRKRPELLSCVAFAKDAAQNNANSVFNKLRFTQKSVQTGYVTEEVKEGVIYLTTRIFAEGRVKAYSFFENWEAAEIYCAIPEYAKPIIRLDPAK